jgi:putative transposase
MKKRFTEEQIVGIVSEANAGARAIEVCRRHGIREETVYCWKAAIIGSEKAITQESRLKKVRRVFGSFTAEETF